MTITGIGDMTAVSSQLVYNIRVLRFYDINGNGRCE